MTVNIYAYQYFPVKLSIMGKPEYSEEAEYSGKFTILTALSIYPQLVFTNQHQLSSARLLLNDRLISVTL